MQSNWEQSVYPLARDFRLLEVVLPKVSPQPHTHLAFEGYQFAERKGMGETINHRLFVAFFQEEQDLGDNAVLTNLAQELVTDGQEFSETLASRKFRQVHLQVRRQAIEEMGIRAVPTFVIGT